MPTARKHPEDARRVAALHALQILDTEPEERFDRITRLAQRLFDTQMSAVTLIDADRQWFKSEIGLGERENGLRDSFCAHAILGAPQAMVVGDASLDPRLADNPMVLEDPRLRFYAGQPIAAPGGEPIGTLCVFDDRARDVTDFDAEVLAELAGMVEAEIASLSLAIGDELTGLSNRRGFEMLGERLLAAARRLGLPASAIYADLDNLKPINDLYGHEAGDRALIDAAAVLAASMRASDLLARLGGDEFCALLIGSAATAAPTLVSRVQATLAERNATSPDPYELAMSLGLAEALPGEEVDLWDLVGRADTAMIEAKRAKKAGEGEALAR
ncbi:MAG: sensor domain-containing diguanylate cyclase [Actinobacteria bacterium]|nr:sensor domain-containing diguanylate cyclase [Actinomycetota bacterium]